MKIRVGTDIVAVERIRLSHERFGKRFLGRFLDEEEQALVTKTETAAGFWAAKEAIAKALGCGIGETLGFHDMYLSKDAQGAPTVRFSPEALRRHNIEECSLSISHDAGFALAVAVVVIAPKGVAHDA